jgi:hypothetical protein
MVERYTCQEDVAHFMDAQSKAIKLTPEEEVDAGVNSVTRFTVIL